MPHYELHKRFQHKILNSKLTGPSHFFIKLDYITILDRVCKKRRKILKINK